MMLSWRTVAQWSHGQHDRNGKILVSSRVRIEPRPNYGPGAIHMGAWIWTSPTRFR